MVSTGKFLCCLVDELHPRQMLADFDKLSVAKAQVPAFASVHEHPNMRVPASHLEVPFHDATSATFRLESQS